MTEQEQKAFEQMREALEKPAYTHALALQNISEALELVMRWIDDYCDTGPETGFEAIESKVNEALTAANAVSHPQATEPAWRPIESAPRNGTLVLLATDGGIVFVGKLNKHLQLWVDDEGRERFRTVTYWMPLPAALEAKQ